MRARKDEGCCRGRNWTAGAGGAGVAILEIDPGNCQTLSTTLYGDVQDETAVAAATDGADLYVASELRSSSSVEGNSVGQNDFMLLLYTIESTGRLWRSTSSQAARAP